MCFSLILVLLLHTIKHSMCRTRHVWRYKFTNSLLDSYNNMQSKIDAIWMPYSSSPCSVNIVQPQLLLKDNDWWRVHGLLDALLQIFFNNIAILYLLFDDFQKWHNLVYSRCFTLSTVAIPFFFKSSRGVSFMYWLNIFRQPMMTTTRKTMSFFSITYLPTANNNSKTYFICSQ